MITLPRTQFIALTGQEILKLLARQARRQTGDVKIDSQTWRVYRSTERRKGTFVNLWREVPNGDALPTVEWVRGRPEQRIGEMRKVE